ncbi:NusB antitermination factor [Beutenbergia cavernae DSM 12333]|uniref:Transcription antitermination protein NusB n=1 Tax=Beutenbergia cavernae (strain ATCC BAA-8 / DSM 12333 / CCUG 43141 / JCM 11478 / NBRC 16432 / NCIMB 13614 / HKI 0122) TaxID=471853 RepID=NUSB_BEUC1|nr:transcription antitermination factor NusB [Beutenbergia cavernae]C5C681.1 RecName: Full=Transcription antitermination protein NusB; AltName: Full=Antitermination factor NusB [Beutenbergia cavernae DSM 12333]ACQ80287.1 NusB antitermination factor [Beutenbergia cavernae DSM 12333]
MAARRKARKRALDLLYEADQKAVSGGAPASGDAVALLAERIATPHGEAPMREYTVEIVEGVAAHQARIDELLETYAQGWSLERMPAVDRAILRIGVWELLFNDDVPDAVAVDEAVALAAELSTDDSPTFVNGLLGQLLRLAPVLRDEEAAAGG